MTSGGACNVGHCVEVSYQLVESGPAGGAILASGISTDLNLHKVISFDMGGTTAKICLIDEFEAQRAREFEVGRQARVFKGVACRCGYLVSKWLKLVQVAAPLPVSMGSIKSLGPDSAGAEPGPAAYGRGGRPTITDADIHLRSR